MKMLVNIMLAEFLRCEWKENARALLTIGSASAQSHFFLVLPKIFKKEFTIFSGAAVVGSKWGLRVHFRYACDFLGLALI